MRQYAIIFLSLFIICNVNSQDDNVIEKELKFENETSDKVYDVEVTDEENLILAISSAIETGYLKVTLIDPNGKEESRMQLEASGSRVKIKTKDQDESKVKSTSKDNDLTVSGSAVQITSGQNVVLTTGSQGSAQAISISADGNGKDVVIKGGDGKATTISSGGVTIIKGQAQTITTSGGSGANGNTVKTIENPFPGKWSIKIEAQDVSGILKYSIIKK